VYPLHAHTVADTVAVCPCVRLPLDDVTTMRSFDSSEWNVPAVPSEQELLIVFGWLGSAPPDMWSRPSNNDGPESHEVPTVVQAGALYVEL